jgi:hypothetical protein
MHPSGLLLVGWGTGLWRVLHIFNLLNTWRDKKWFLHLTGIMLRMFSSIYTQEDNWWISIECFLQVKSKECSEQYLLWGGVDREISRSCMAEGLILYSLQWWMNIFIMSGSLACCRNSGATGDASVLGAVVFWHILFPITVPFRPNLTVEGTGKLVAKTMRWVVRWHVECFRCKWETCLVSARKSYSICFTLDLCLFLAYFSETVESCKS